MYFPVAALMTDVSDNALRPKLAETRRLLGKNTGNRGL